MNLSDFDYELPEELIAQFPLEIRSSSRLLEVVTSSQSLTPNFKQSYFREVTELLSANDVLVLNDTKVIPARIYGFKDTQGKVEIFIERLLDNHKVLAQIRASKPPKANSIIWIGQEPQRFPIKVLNRHLASEQPDNISPFYELEFPSDALTILYTVGEVPLPPYIKHTATQLDHDRYQTVIAKNPGAVAAPTAALHFDHDLLKQIKAKGVQICYITLHVGAGTFLPVRHEDVSLHQMHFEKYQISPETRSIIDQAKLSGKRIVAVGTTALRALESAALMGDSGDTNLFITPGFNFKVVDALITNFNLPKSTLLMLVSAFIGSNNIKQSYQYAMSEKFRFFSYGDAMFLNRQ